MSRTARTIATFAAVVASIALAISPAAWAAVRPRTSLTAIEPDLMCTACSEPLSEAQSPEANSERSYIRTLIAEGLTKQQIERNLVAQYGPAVLGRPPAHGLNLTIYILPPAVLVAGIAILAVTLPRWRRRTRRAAGQPAAAPPDLDPVEAQRLEHELTQYGG